MIASIPVGSRGGDDCRINKSKKHSDIFLEFLSHLDQTPDLPHIHDLRSICGTLYRLRSRYFRPPGTLCREVNGARFTFSGNPPTASGDGLTIGGSVLRFVLFRFVVIAFPRHGQLRFVSSPVQPP